MENLFNTSTGWVMLTIQFFKKPKFRENNYHRKKMAGMVKTFIF